MESHVLAMAAMLLVTPPGVKESVTPEDWAELRPGILRLAQEWEIMDPREARYFLPAADSFDDDLDLLRHRYQRFKDAPKIAEVGWLPPYTIIFDLLAFNRRYREYLNARLPLEVDRPAYREAVKETDALYAFWDSVRDARSEYYYVIVRREALLRIKTMLGDEAYFQHDFPPFVPFWRFVE